MDENSYLTENHTMHIYTIKIYRANPFQFVKFRPLKVETVLPVEGGFHNGLGWIWVETSQTWERRIRLSKRLIQRKLDSWQKKQWKDRNTRGVIPR